MRGVLILGAALTAFAASALALPADIGGAWSFHTNSFDGCVISGDMTIVRAAGANAYTCTFTTKQTCDNVVGGATQTCTAKREGAKLTIKSKVKSFDWSPTYDPDDFELTIVSGAYMKGAFSSTHRDFTDQAIVEFYRGDAPVS